jgi:riboflavin kinase/FMN adenylyltransferase
MHIIRKLDELPAEARGGAAAIGNFDGVHLGHVRIVRRMLQRASEVGGPAVVFTFDPHPVRILRPAECPPPLTWTRRKADLLAAHGVDWIVAYPTDEALLRLSAAEFFQQIVRDALDARALVEGPNFYFGHNREGDIERLAELAAAARMTLDVVEPVEVDGQLVSSSRIRRLLADGDVGRARLMLSAPYRIRGMVTHGAGRGARLGFPTANLDAIDTLLPAHGVYAGRGWADGQSWPAAINLGPSPTFGDALVKVEVHLIGRTEPLYGQPLEVDFLERLREIRPFDTPDELTAQLERDVSDVLKMTDSSFTT